MTGIHLNCALLMIMEVHVRPSAPRTLERKTVERVSSVDLVHKRFHKLHKYFKDHVDKRRESRIAVQYKATNIISLQCFYWELSCRLES